VLPSVAMNVLRALIVDDERPARENLRVLLEGRDDVVIVGFCASGAAAVRALTTHERVDVVFLDIRLPDMSGFDVLKALEAGERPVVVFVTAYHQHAVAAFEANAIDYLVKPFSDERFEATMERVHGHVEARDVPELWRRIRGLLEATRRETREPPLRRLVVRTHGRTEFLSVQEIDWIEAVNVYIRVHAGKSQYLIRQTMTELESRLDPVEFVRIHRGAIVHLARVEALQRDAEGHDEVLLRDGTRLRLSRARREALERALGQRL
jgi:two-component system LytT family response regulator